MSWWSRHTGIHNPSYYVPHNVPNVGTAVPTQTTTPTPGPNGTVTNVPSYQIGPSGSAPPGSTSIGGGPAAGQVGAVGGTDKYYTDPITGQRDLIGSDAWNARAHTARTLALLQSTLGQGRQQGIGQLRANLAQRGLLDSGNLGAGLTQMNDQYGRQMAQGTLAAANNEGDALMSLIQQERQRQFASQQQQAQFAHDQAMLQLQQQFQMDQRPGAEDYLLGGLGNVAGTALGYRLGGLIPGK